MGPNVWVESAGLAAEEAEDLRDLYAAAATRWVDEGRTAHYVLVPAHDQAAVGAWFRLAFGHQHTHAVREVPPVPRRRRPRVVVRRAVRDDIPALARLDLELPLHQGLAPTFSAGDLGSYEESVQEWEEDFDDPEFATFVAEHDGRVVGSAVGCPLDKSSTNDGLARPENAGFLGFAAVLPEPTAARRGPGPRRGGAGLVAGAAARLRGHRLAGHEPAVLPGLAGARVPADVPAPAPAPRLLTRPDRDVRMLDIRATPRTAAVRVPPVQHTWTYFFGFPPGAPARDAR